jgi:hypothetical protein
MRKLFAVPVAMLAAAGLAACSESPTESFTPQFELVDPSQRIAVADVNAHVYGSFALSFDVTTGSSGGWGVIRSGPANFPGNPKNAGMCDDGLWINPQGKRTSGSMDKPHPHCVGETEGDLETTTVHVVLEPISAEFTTSEDRTSGQTWQRELKLGSGLGAKVAGNGVKTEAAGSVEAFAINASTLGTTNVRVGILTFDLAQFASEVTNYFDTDCTIADVDDAPRCLDLVITATYAPLAVGGVGVVNNNVTGFLYWSPATSPFNY